MIYVLSLLAPADRLKHLAVKMALVAAFPAVAVGAGAVEARRGRLGL
jgi:hypothetical protein